MRTTSMKAVFAGLPPLAVYLMTASGYAHWFDSGELLAAATDFGISHPPGQPFAGIVLGVSQFIPVGPLAFRASVVCAVFGAVAVVALTFAIERTLAAGNVVRGSLRFPIAVAGAWWVATSYAWWFQAVRPEVYALQAALLCVALERLLAASFSDDVRPLYQAGLVFGLALANHHYLAVLAMVPALWLIVGVARRAGWVPFAWAGAFAIAGLLTYLYLPIRALAQPLLNLGDPSSPARFWWVFSAQAFQKSLAPGVVAPFGDRLADVLLVTGEDLHIVMLLLALLGAYFMLRLKATRKYGLFWLTLWAVYALGRASIGFVHGNPDAIAYFMLSYAPIVLFAGFALGVVGSALAEAAPSHRAIAPAIGVTLILASTVQLARSAEASSLAGFDDTDVFDDGLRRSLPARSVLLVHNPQTIFRYWGGHAEEANRPDVTMVPLPLLTYPKLIDRLVKDDPELRALLRSYALDGRLSSAELQSLAALRPVFVEMDVRVDTETMQLLVPELLYHRVLTAGSTDTDEATAMREHGALWSTLYGRIDRPIDPHTQAQLLWRHYADSLYFAAVGDNNAARRTVAAGLRLNPHAKELLALRQALNDASPDERIDVAPFVVR